MSKVVNNTSIKEFNILLVGGSGLWSEANHIPNILAIKSRKPNVRVGAICDIQNPYALTTSERANLPRLLKRDAPYWVAVEENVESVLAKLGELHSSQPFDLVVIASSPVTHMDYALWALENGISVVGDKPIIVSANAASDPMAANAIQDNYKRLCDAYEKARLEKPYLSFSLILRRRSLPAFNSIAEKISLVAGKYDAVINHLNILNHGGIYRYPNEMLGEGAHDFTNGIGALSHSSYHYIDLFNWYLSLAQGKIKYLKPTLSSVTRIKDYLDGAGYSILQKINNHEVSEVGDGLPEEVLAAELDFSFNIKFYDKEKRLVGDGNFINNHLSFTPRTHAENAHLQETNGFRDLGRISHLYVDVHQSGVQNIQLVKNDVMGVSPNIFVQGRSHPAIVELPDFDRQEFANAYLNTQFKLEDMLELVIDANMRKVNVDEDLIIDLTDDARNIALFSKFYELIALDYQNNQNITDNNFIELA